jgi:hypothetical protein
MDGISNSFDQVNSFDQPGSDQLAASVLRSLSRSVRNQFSISTIQALGLGLITFGFWPLFRLRKQFRDYLLFEKQQLWHAAEWIRTRRGSEPASALTEYAKQVRYRDRWILATLAGLCAAAVVIVVAVSMPMDWSWAALMERTYRFRQLTMHARTPELVMAFVAWNAGLALAYGLQWLRVRLHVRDVAQYVREFNAVAAREGVPAIEPPEFDSGLRTGWVVVAIVLALLGALWGIPMALAGAAQRRYINGIGSPLRAELLDRVRQMVAQHRPVVAVPSYVIHDRRCRNSNCRATLRAGGQFCQRCGTSVTAVERIHTAQVA